MELSTTQASPRNAAWRFVASAVAAAVIATGGAVALPATAAQAAPMSAAERFAPTLVPDRITLTPAADPTTGQTVTWRSITGVAAPVVQYRTITSESYPLGVNEADAIETTLNTGDYAHSFYRAELTGLNPNTHYMYRVGDGTNFSEWQDFATAAVGESDFSFIYLGDLQTGIEDHASRVVRNAFRDRPNASLVLQAGDIVDEAQADGEWAEVWEAFDYTLGVQNLLVAPGNHDYTGESRELWKAQLGYPSNGPSQNGLDGFTYVVDYQGVRFITLNSNHSSGELLNAQTAWLEAQLTDNPNKWTVVMMHHPIYALNEGRNNITLRNAWGPLLEEHNVDLVLMGHDHAYGRGNTLASAENLPEGADPAVSSTGPVYVVATVGSKFYNPGPANWIENDAHLKRMAAATATYQLVDVSGDTMRYESRTADGEFFDGVTITKSEAGKLVTDGVEPEVIDPGTPLPCLGCDDIDPEEPGEPGDPGDSDGDLDLNYQVLGNLSSVDNTNARLAAGLTFSQSRGMLYLGDQNGRNIFEIDPDTDEIKRTITLPENIRDLGIDDENNLLYVGQQNRNWVVVSIADDSFGEIVRGSFPIIESNRSIDVDPVGGYVYAAVPARGVEVFNADTGASIGVIRDTKDAYYVAADPVDGIVVSTKFYADESLVNIEAFDSRDGFRKLWGQTTRISPRQVDIDSTNGLLYVGYTGTSAERGGFSVHDLATGKLLGDFAGPEYGKDGYGIVVDEERQRVFVANRDFRLNPPGEELVGAAVTVSERVLDGEPGDGEPGDGEPGDGEPGDGEPTDPPTGTEYVPTASTAVANAIDDPDSSDTRTVGSAVNPSSGNVFIGNEMRPARIIEWNPVSDEVVRTIEVAGAEGEGVRDVAIDADENELYVAYSNQLIVLDIDSGAIKRGPFSFNGSARGMDIDTVTKRVFGATRGTGVDILNGVTGERIETFAPSLTGWRTHGVEFDEVNGLLYLSNSDADGSTEGVRVYDGETLELVRALEVAAADFRSITVDPVAERFYVGHQSSTFNQSGVSVYSTDTFELIVTLSDHAYGNKVYGVSVDSSLGKVYVSARDRHPAWMITLQRQE